MKQFKKLLAALLVVALILPGISIMEAQMEEVQAQETNTQKIAPEQDGKVFAGYYVDEQYKTTSNVEGGTKKFVDEGVLSLKMQLKTNQDGSYDLRLVSTVDTLNYRNVGFKIGFDKDGDKAFAKNEISNWTTSEVAHRVDGTYNQQEVKVPFSYSPKVIDTKSEYFITGIMEGIQAKYVANDFLITPFWTTLDGTRVEGQSRWFSIEDMVKTNINIPVEMTEDEYNSATIGTDGFTLSEKYYDGKYAHFNLTVADKTALPSATTVTIGNKPVIYRNLESQGTVDANFNSVSADTTWYTAYPDETEYVIANAAELWGMAKLSKDDSSVDYAGKTIYLVADIAVNDVTKVNWTTGVVEEGYTTKAWHGVTYTTPFAGTFDGQMHSIKGLYQTAGVGRGLFGTITTGSTVKNLKIEQSYIKAARAAGAVAGTATGGTIDTVYSTATVTTTTAQYYWGTGGIAGVVNANTTINNCWNAGSVIDNGTEGWNFAGGIVGKVQDGACATITNCLNTGYVRGYSARANTFAGGIVGGTTSATCNISNCIGSGQVRNSSGYVGGCYSIIGSVDTAGTSIRNSYGTDGNGSMLCQPEANATMQNANRVDASTLYGATGWATTFLNDDYWVAVEDGVPELKSFRSMSAKAEADVSAVNRPADTSWYDIAPSASEFTLYTEEEYKGLITIAGTMKNGIRENFTSKIIKLGADLVLNEGDAKDWANAAPKITYSAIYDPNAKSYGTFDGTFDGRGHSISGLYIPSTGAYTSMFGKVGVNCNITDFRLLNSYIPGGEQAGAIVGRADGGTISSVYTDAIVSGTRYLGGIVGISWGGNLTIQNCEFAGEVKSTLTSGDSLGVGCIIGDLNGGTANITNCLNTGIMTIMSSGLDLRSGGIAGQTRSSATLNITSCLNTGTVDTPNAAGKNHVGSIFGRYIGGTAWNIVRSYATTESNPLGTYYSGYNATSTVGQLSEAELTGAGGYAWTTLDETAWVAVKGGTPQLKKFQTTVAADIPNGRVDTSWYDQGTTSGVTYTLRDAGDFFGFVQLAQTVDFAGQTVKIADGVTEIDLSDVLCKPICAYNRGFAGVFDGNNATIKGLYIVNNKQFTAMFGGVAATGVVKNFDLVDSYIESIYDVDAGQYVASIVARFCGTLTNVSSDAKVVCNRSYAAGLVAQTWGTAPQLSTCSFGGELYMVQSDATYAGGIIGETRTLTVVEHCLFDGTIISNKTAYVARTGGIVGNVTGGETQLNDCLSSGTISFPKNNGSINTVGSVVGGVLGTLKITGPVQATSACYHDADQNAICFGNTPTEGADKVTVFGASAYGTIGTLSSDYWMAVQGGTPILK